MVRVQDEQGYIEGRSEVLPTALSLSEAAATLRAAMRDRSYRATPVGELVGRYVRWLRNEWGATESTVRDYEAVLARMSLTLADREPLTVTVDDLRDVIDLWADREARTRGKVTSSSGRFGRGQRSTTKCRSRPRRSCGDRVRLAGQHRCCRTMLRPDF